MGAQIDTYLLERSRVVRVPEREANYHVLYALVDGCPADLAPELGLRPQGEYEVLPTGSRGGICITWASTAEAMLDVGFEQGEVSDLTRALAALLPCCPPPAALLPLLQVSDLARALAAVLALTRLRFGATDDAEGNREAHVLGGEEALAAPAKCLSVEVGQLAEALTSRRTYLATGDSYVKCLDEHQSADATDALAKVSSNGR